MSTVRKQSIISSLVIYFGFALGLFNTYLFTRKGGFTEAQFGLTGIFIAIANIMFSVASLGMPAYIGKFFPYYQTHLKREKNDLLTWALLIPVLGFGLVLIFGYFFKNILIDKVFSNSPELPQYYYWTFPFGFGLTLFMVLEAYAWQQRKAVLSNFSREVLFRLFTTTLIVLTITGVITSFDVFIRFYAFEYIALSLILILYFIATRKFHFVFEPSKVTKRFRDKIILLCSFVWGGSLVYNIANVFDTIVLAAVLPNGIAMAGIFTFAQNLSSLIQAPQRGIISASVGPLSQAWKDKDLTKINTIYYRSSVNQLLFSCAMFCLIWLNFDEGIRSFNLKESFLQAKDVFLFIGLMRIVDMGTGVNAQIISTSIFWRFEFLTGLLLLALALPLNYLLTIKLGLIGPSISNLIAFTIYNGIRYGYLLRKFRMQPFNRNTVIIFLLAGSVYVACLFLFKSQHGLGWIIIRSFCYLLLFGGGAIFLKLSPDIIPVGQTLLKKLRLQHD
ncbi:MAG: lipopolysaccharide biosynthesis protein [Flaviaesturariibacter sp.]|nr:lipopolysaccharide biosynthesis protein [Flaviaesturariibacter sp.]